MCLREFPTRSDSNWPAQLLKLAWGLKVWLQKLETLYYLGSENKGADQTARMRRLICAFVVRIWHQTRFLMDRLNYNIRISVPQNNLPVMLWLDEKLRVDFLSEVYRWTLKGLVHPGPAIFKHKPYLSGQEVLSICEFEISYYETLIRNNILQQIKMSFIFLRRDEVFNRRHQWFDNTSCNAKLLDDIGSWAGCHGNGRGNPTPVINDHCHCLSSNTYVYYMLDRFRFFDSQHWASRFAEHIFLQKKYTLEMHGIWRLSLDFWNLCCWWILCEPPHDKTNKMTSAPSEDSDQPGHCWLCHAAAHMYISLVLESF